MAKNSDWDESRIQIGKQHLHIKLPPNESKDFPPNASLQLVNLNDERLDTDAQSITAVNKYWDFRAGLFKGVQGTLNIKVRVRKVPSSFEGDITNYAELEKLLMERLSKSGSELSSHCISEIINDKKWLSYQLKGGVKSIDYVFPLTESTYIQVQADFINNSKDANPKWLKKAQDILSEIASSIVIIN